MNDKKSYFLLWLFAWFFVIPQVGLAQNTGKAKAPALGVADGWQYRVAEKDLPGIDNLVLDANDMLYATQELPGGAGKVIRFDHGVRKTVVSGLDRSDGLLLRGKFLYITEEVNDGRVIEFDSTTKKQRVLATLNHPEGVELLPDGDLVVAEDNMNGHLRRVSRKEGQMAEIILGGLNRPEGLAVTADGAIIIAETATGRVLSYKNGAIDVVLDDLDEPDQVEFAPDGALWITEDVHSGRLLRLKDGQLETILSGLKSPQGMAFGKDGTVWLAERGRQRILAINPKKASP
jgi:glucose/arabinose dehydrogenase